MNLETLLWSSTINQGDNNLWLEKEIRYLSAIISIFNIQCLWNSVGSFGCCFGVMEMILVPIWYIKFNLHVANYCPFSEGFEDHTAGRLREAGDMSDVVDCGTREKIQWQSIWLSSLSRDWFDVLTLFMMLLYSGIDEDYMHPPEMCDSAVSIPFLLGI